MSSKNETMVLDTTTQRRTNVTVLLIREYLETTFKRILVVGCGSGIEAVTLAKEFINTEVIGIDLDPSGFNPLAADLVDLRKGDATHLEFSDNHFDLVYSFHALEHIPQPETALSEMARVLVAGGGFFIGTPNRGRLIGYLGSETASWKEKFAWNWYDWKARWQGRFDNKYGAHAGFLSQELLKELELNFVQVKEITIPYYLELYKSQALIIHLLARLGLGRILFPAIFFGGRK